MPTMTLIDMVQDILSEMNSDPVNSITETEEAYQVARIIKNSFYEIIQPKHHKYYDKLHVLFSSGNSTKPTYMRLPEDILDVHWVKYNNKTVEYKDPSTFLGDAANLTSNYIEQTDDEGITFKVGNNLDATYWTSFDEKHIVFNSYDSTSDSIMQSSKSAIYAVIEPSFSLTDNFIADMPPQMFPQLLAEAKSTCFAHIKQMPSQKAEASSNKQRRRLSTKSKLNNGVKYPNYGRS